MNIANALPIEGWMEPHDLEWLAEHAAKAKRIVEVGCWHGRSTTVLADNTEGVVFAVDTWKGSEEHYGSLPETDKEGYALWCERVYTSFLKNMEPYIRSGKVIPIHLASVDAARRFQESNQTFDMVFIDAAHDYDNVKADILAWKPLVSGLFCGHDAGHPPVMKATHELLPTVQHEHSMWVVQL
jgi:Methyltransferase domain